ncbi:MAG TPA: 3-isopropylmalate dehydratase large subunit, partial [Bacillota bacterium]|nr:3-isopropylmalate dehydratase large subunit [Bacillota bacterium]
KIGVNQVFDRERIALVPDHFTPNKDIKSAEQVKMMREFAREYEIVNYFEVGEMGVEHCLLPEKGLVVPGDVVIGADSHTCTYGALGAFSTGVGSTDMAAGMALGEAWFKVPESIKFIYYGKLPRWVGGKDLILYTIGQIGVDGALYQAMEFGGEAIADLSMEGRFTMANMAIEAGGKNGIFPVDQKTLEYVKARAKRNYTVYQNDPDAKYSKVYEWDISKLEPQIAFPHLPENTKPLSACGKVTIDQSVIGSCTNGRIEDLREAAAVLKGHKVNPNVRLIIIPGTQSIWRQAMHEGLFDIFMDAGAAISTPTCGPCLGGHMGILAKGERAIATTNRNFVGRMGHPESEVYLAGPAVAAASAIAGHIAGPEEVGVK